MNREGMAGCRSLRFTTAVWAARGGERKSRRSELTVGITIVGGGGSLMNPAALGHDNRAIPPGESGMARLAGTRGVIIGGGAVGAVLGGDLEFVPGDRDTHGYARYTSHQTDIDSMTSSQTGHDVETKGWIEGKAQDRRFGQEAVDLTHPGLCHADTVIGHREEVALLVEEPGYSDAVGGR
jgi:hypothetical protein